MPNDYAKATGAPATATVAGREFPVYKLRPVDLGLVDAWLKEITPNPKAEAIRYIKEMHAAGLPESVQTNVWNRAVEEARSWPPTSDTAEGNALLMATNEGRARMLYAVLKRGTPTLTVADCRAIVDEAEQEELNRVVELASPGDPTDPKSGATATATGTSSTTSGPAPTSA